MTSFGRTNTAAAIALLAILAARPDPAWPWLVAVVVAWHAVVGWGVFRLDSGYFCSATCRTERGDAVALTFDDGPDPGVTPALLDLLAERGVPAAFFTIGARVAEHPELARRTVREGHLVENHTQHHRILTNFLFTDAMTAEIEACSAAIEDATGVRPGYYRPPFGLSNHATAGAARRAGLDIVGWQVRGFDNRGTESRQVVERVLDRVRPGGIVLLHDGGRDPERVLANVAGILDGLASRGLRVERLDRLIGRPASSRPHSRPCLP